ncbi:hypothetical protein MGU_09502 [Metarhizium guizhouense ARSEF 977]|uniref:Uncharacterized protein n=1 Tax=Metarhizium guizhouense (strain ARSEF 977) TaxID=1276136 RepID=A0A0B4H0C5_METGA|nr:hypothetical protein MGU_09502 [Metarhizium guizhouense ARSEF 977]
MELMETFKKYSADLEAFYKNVRTRVLPTGSIYYFGEYLSQGRLTVTGRCSEANVQQMIELGLFDLCPHGLRDEVRWSAWAKPVVQWREEAFHENPGLTERPEFRKALTIAASCFGDEWALPLTIMLISLKSRKQKDRVIQDGIRATFTDAEIEGMDLKNVKVDSRQLPEVAQIERIFVDVREQLQPTLAEQIFHLSLN